MVRFTPLPLLVLAVFVSLLITEQIGATEPFRFPEARHGETGQLRYIKGIPVLTVSGTPEQIGEAIGVLALRPANRVLNYPRELCRLRGAEWLWGSFLATGRSMYRQFPADTLTETEAMIRTAAADRDLVVAGNTFFDIKKVFACSAIAISKERSATHGTVLARNLDYPSLGYIHHYSLVTVYRPKGKRAFACVGFPGLVGVLSGMNDAGLSVGVLEVFDLKSGEVGFDPRGLPYMLCLRRVLEEAQTIPEAIRVLEKLRRTTTINIAIADRDRVAILEVSPGRVVERRPDRGVAVTTNHFCSADLRATKPANVTMTFERFVALEELRHAADRLTLEDLRRRLDAVNLGSQTLQTMAFEPAHLRLHLGVGKVPSSRLPFVQLDLADLLRTDEKRR